MTQRRFRASAEGLDMAGKVLPNAEVNCIQNGPERLKNQEEDGKSEHKASEIKLTKKYNDKGKH